MFIKPIDLRLPVLSLLFSATFWGVVWYPLRLLEEQGMNGLWTTLVAYSSALIVVVPVFWRFRGEVVSHPRILLLLVLAAGWCNVAFVLAVIEGHVVRVLLLFYLSPIWTLIFGRLVLDEKLAPEMPWILLVAMSGALFMLWDPDAGIPWPQDRADWLALSSGMGFAVTNVLFRYLQDISLITKTFLSWIGVVVVATLGILVYPEAIPPVSPLVWSSAALLGITGFLAATFAVAYGVTHMPVQRSAVILLFELVAGGVSAALLAGESILPREWIGGLLILVAAYIASRKMVITE